MRTAANADGAPSSQTLNVQGVLRTIAGDLQSTAVGLDVNLYASQADKTSFFSQHFTTVGVGNGFFSVELSGMNLSFNSADAWIGIQVAGDATEMPRQHLTAVPYAYNAANAQQCTTANDAAQLGGKAANTYLQNITNSASASIQMGDLGNF